MRVRVVHAMHRMHFGVWPPEATCDGGSRTDASDAVHALHAVPAAPAVHAMHAFRRHTAKGIIASDCKGTPLNSRWGNPKCKASCGKRNNCQ